LVVSELNNIQKAKDVEQHVKHSMWQLRKELMQAIFGKHVREFQKQNTETSNAGSDKKGRWDPRRKQSSKI